MYCEDGMEFYESKSFTKCIKEIRLSKDADYDMFSFAIAAKEVIIVTDTHMYMLSAYISSAEGDMRWKIRDVNFIVKEDFPFVIKEYTENPFGKMVFVDSDEDYEIELEYEDGYLNIFPDDPGYTVILLHTYATYLPGDYCSKESKYFEREEDGEDYELKIVRRRCN